MSSGPGVLSEEDDHGVEGGQQEDCQAGEVMVSWWPKFPVTAYLRDWLRVRSFS